MSCLTDRIAQYLIQQPFYHGFLPRDDIVFILKKKGDFILRTTERNTPKGRRRELVLSVASPQDKKIVGQLDINDIKNILIERTPNGNGVFIHSKLVFDGMDELLTYYKRNTMRITKSEPTIRLGKPIGLMSWEFRHQSILLTKKVGQGAYGEVFKGKVKRGKKTFDAAIKAMKNDQDANSEKMKEVMAEARLMRMMNHPNIVRIRGIAVLEQPLYIIIDYINGGGLDTYLKKNAATLSVEDKNKMAISAAWGIEFMHSQNILHRDIAARNCLYDSKNYVKLSDFGLSRKGETYEMLKARKMPTKWLAPESLKTFIFSKASDVYTYGVLLYEIYMCVEPFVDISSGEARRQVLAGNFPDFKKKAPTELWNIVKEKVYVLDPKKRSKMTEIVKALEEWLEVELVLEADEMDKEQDTIRKGVDNTTDGDKSEETKHSKRKGHPNIPLGSYRKKGNDTTATVDKTVENDRRDKEIMKPDNDTEKKTTSSRSSASNKRSAELAKKTSEQLITAETENNC